MPYFNLYKSKGQCIYWHIAKWNYKVMTDRWLPFNYLKAASILFCTRIIKWKRKYHKNMFRVYDVTGQNKRESAVNEMVSLEMRIFVNLCLVKFFFSVVLLLNNSKIQRRFKKHGIPGRNKENVHITKVWRKLLQYLKTLSLSRTIDINKMI